MEVPDSDIRFLHFPSVIARIHYQLGFRSWKVTSEKKQAVKLQPFEKDCSSSFLRPFYLLTFSWFFFSLWFSRQSLGNWGEKGISLGLSSWSWYSSSNWLSTPLATLLRYYIGDDGKWSYSKQDWKYFLDVRPRYPRIKTQHHFSRLSF